jgi:flagellin-like hook-associated protein FlgL
LANCPCPTTCCTSREASAIDETLNAIDEANPTEESILLSKSQDLAESAFASLSILDQQQSLVVSLLSEIAGI